MYIYILLFVLIILLIINIIYIKKSNKEEFIYLSNKNKEFINALTQSRAKADIEISQKEEKISKFSNEIHTKEVELNSLTARLDEKKELTDTLLKKLDEEVEKKKAYISETVSTYYEDRIARYQEDIYDEITQIQNDASEELQSALNENQKEIDRLKAEISSLKAEIDEYKQNRDIINNEILRQREISENEDFYRICLSDEAKEDIALLLTIMPRLSKREAFNKLIYDTYVSKEVQEMVKRVLKGRAPSGIYKITRLKTKEVYIGQSTNIKDRWQQHCKSAFNVGSIAHSQLHTTMEKDGIENFTFEFLEECDKDKLRERESYWIKFYGSKEFGLNMKL